MIAKKIVLGLTLIISALFSSEAIAQKQIVFEGVTIPRTMKFENKTLQLNGAGSRSKMWVEVYIQALYLSQLSQNPKEIINDNVEMSIRIEITSALVSSGKLTRAINAGFEKSAGDTFESFKPRMELLKGFLADEITKGDVYELTYSPADTSIWIIKNGELKGKIPGFDFKKVFFGIWLGDKPVDEDLKNNLLGIF
ncbi:chalcone isomerase family protein [Flavobacterium aquicola]|uniref:Chalcone isomerase-like protein n=1 Tax=Flavobacterium aquicola TaxID=1682742 RepID=A0A3E0EIP3_9FLAO|nr:chalcone isomerase family protein [Flavobacterium aquicola]REG98122.1 chalcone isomerase-like protein [Flavobacterium aquicola]